MPAPYVTVIRGRAARQLRLVEVSRALAIPHVRVATQQNHFRKPHEVSERQAEVEYDRVAGRQNGACVDFHPSGSPDFAAAIASDVINVPPGADGARSHAALQLDGKEERRASGQAFKILPPAGMNFRIEEGEIGDAVVAGTEIGELRMKVEMVDDEGLLARERTEIESAQRWTIADHETAVASMEVAERLDPAAFVQQIEASVQHGTGSSHRGAAGQNRIHNQGPVARGARECLDHTGFAPSHVSPSPSRRRFHTGVYSLRHARSHTPS